MHGTRVLLVDDHELVRAGINLLLEHIPGLFITEAANGPQALEILKQERIGLLLTDIAMKGMSGLELAAQVKREYPDIKIIMISMHGNEEYVLQALRAGASGYLLKDSATKELADAIHAVLGGDTYLSPPISRQVVENYVSRTGGEQRPADLLTPRQREILVMVGEGMSTREIAQKLSVSTKTVETHRSLLMERLQIHEVAGLVRYAIRMGLVSLDK